MAITINTKIAPEQYTPARERGSEDPTTFTLKPLNGFEYLDVISHATQDGGQLSITGMRKCIGYGLTGADNLKDENGRDVKLDAGQLDPVLLAELAGRILTISHLSEDERKN